jgi:DNA-binding response OmpR family regulator
MRVLIVEDNELLRDSLLQGLREGGFSVDPAADGTDGLWLAETGDYDVIVLDLMLPGVDGLSLLSSLREKQKGTHVLILTAKDTVEDRIKGLNLGADDYLVKPFAFQELLARVHALVRRRYQQKSPTITLGDIDIDTTRKSVARQGTPIDLTPREYALLEYLAFRSGEVVSRTEIWEHLYEFESETTSNVVDVFIKRLREKLGSQLIQTKRGQGYILAVEEA